MPSSAATGGVSRQVELPGPRSAADTDLDVEMDMGERLLKPTSYA
jgi:hypothetical protein